MGRQLRVVHHTGYRYPKGVMASHNEARMTPRSNREQLVLASNLEISPTAWTYPFRDYWGTQVTAFEISAPHDRLTVVATSTVEIGDRVSVGQGLSLPEIRERAGSEIEVEMLQLTDHVDAPAELRTLADALRQDGASPGEAVRAVVGAIRGRVDYVPGSTQIQTRAAEVWEAGAGVCQDLVHLGLGALRKIGIPARYVSGYVMPSEDPVVGQVRTGESHAWLQYWDGHWVGIDPTNDTSPGDFHVELGTGRDYFDVPPLKGVYAGSSVSDMFVEVEVTVLA